MKTFWKQQPKKKSSGKKKTTPPRPRKKPEPWTPPYPRQPKQPRTIPPLTVTPPEKKIIDVPFTEEKKEQPVRARTEFLKTFRKMTGRRRAFEVWSDFVTMAACAISNAVDPSHYEEREQRYMETIAGYSPEEQNLFPLLMAHTVLALEENPEQDFLGSLYMELGLADKNKYQFFTPYNICDLMGRVTMEDLLEQVQEKGVASINDPCCGAGATLIAAINEARRQLMPAGLNFQDHILVSGQDVDEVVALMCYIQISLLGVAGYVKVGNSLTEPMTQRDAAEDYWLTPIYCLSPIWQFRRALQGMDIGDII